VTNWPRLAFRHLIGSRSRTTRRFRTATYFPAGNVIRQGTFSIRFACKTVRSKRPPHIVYLNFLEARAVFSKAVEIFNVAVTKFRARTRASRPARVESGGGGDSFEKPPGERRKVSKRIRKRDRASISRVNRTSRIKEVGRIFRGMAARANRRADLGQSHIVLFVSAAPPRNIFHFLEDNSKTRSRNRRCFLFRSTARLVTIQTCVHYVRVCMSVCVMSIAERNIGPGILPK